MYQIFGLVSIIIYIYIYDIGVYDHVEINVFPGVEHLIDIQMTKGILDMIVDYFFPAEEINTYQKNALMLNNKLVNNDSINSAFENNIHDINDSKSRYINFILTSIN